MACVSCVLRDQQVPVRALDPDGVPDVFRDAALRGGVDLE